MASLTVTHVQRKLRKADKIRTCRLCVEDLEPPYTVLESDGEKFLSFHDGCFDQLVKMVDDVRTTHAFSPVGKQKETGLVN